MKSYFLKPNETEKFLDDIWLSADELLGDPSLPTTTAGIHYRAKQEHWRFRKREGVRGGKAIEYRLSSISPITRASILSNMAAATTNGTKKQTEEELELLTNDINEELMLKLYRSLPSDESRKRFFSRILVLASELLDSSVAVESEEILQGCGSSENTDPAPQVSTRRKKAG